MISYRIAVMGQGYVGLPQFLEFANQYPVMGFDINPIRVDPYYLVHNAEQLGYDPDVILSVRHVNDFIACFEQNLVYARL